MKLKDLEDTTLVEKATDLETIFNIHQEYGPYLYNLNSTLFVDFEDVDASNFSYYQCGQYDNWQFLSYKLYGTPHLWWALVKVNSPFNAFRIPTNNVIRYLKKDVIINALKQLQ